MLSFPTSARWLTAAAAVACSVVSGCTSTREGTEPTTSAGTEGIGATVGSGGAGGATNGTGGAASSTGAGDGGDASTTTDSAGGAPSASSGGDGGAPAGPGSGGGSSTSAGPSTSSGGPCGVDGDCWGDEEVVCSPGCESEEIFFECDNGEFPDTYLFCSIANDVLRSNVWAHVVDCLREADADAQCDDPQGEIDACMTDAFANACHTDTTDGTCENFGDSCEGRKEVFPIAQCQDELPVLNDEAIDNYIDCFVANAATPCEDVHAICLDLALGN